MICTPQCIVTMSNHLHGDIIRHAVMTFYSLGCCVKEISEFVRFHETWNTATTGDKNVLTNGVNHVFRPPSKSLSIDLRNSISIPPVDTSRISHWYKMQVDKMMYRYCKAYLSAIRCIVYWSIELRGGYKWSWGVISCRGYLQLVTRGAIAYTT